MQLLLDEMAANDPSLLKQMEDCARANSAWVFACRYADTIVDRNCSNGRWMQREQGYRHASDIWLHLRLK